MSEWNGSGPEAAEERLSRRGMRAAARGLTLIELMTALAVLAVLLGVAVPAFDRMAARNQLAMSANRILMSLQSARHTAISRNVRVVFCAGTPAAGCHGDWNSREWVVFIDADADGQLDVGEAVTAHDRIERAPALRMSGTGPFETAVVFRPSGIARTQAGALALGRIRLCSVKDIEPNTTDLVLIGSGRAVTEHPQSPPACD